jgi:hypothetical protein
LRVGATSTTVAQLQAGAESDPRPEAPAAQADAKTSLGWQAATQRHRIDSSDFASLTPV